MVTAAAAGLSAVVFHLDGRHVILPPDDHLRLVSILVEVIRLEDESVHADLGDVIPVDPDRRGGRGSRSVMIGSVVLLFPRNPRAGRAEGRDDRLGRPCRGEEAGLWSGDGSSRDGDPDAAFPPRGRRSLGRTSGPGGGSPVLHVFLIRVHVLLGRVPAARPLLSILTQLSEKEKEKKNSPFINRWKMEREEEEEELCSLSLDPLLLPLPVIILSLSLRAGHIMRRAVSSGGGLDGWLARVPSHPSRLPRIYNVVIIIINTSRARRKWIGKREMGGTR